VSRPEGHSVSKLLVGAALLALPLAAAVAQPARDRPQRGANRGDAPRRRERPGGPFWRRPELTDDQVAELTAFLKKHMAEQAEQLRKLRDEDPARAKWLLYRLYRLYVNVRRFPEDVRVHAIGRYKVNLSIFRTVREIRATQDAAEQKRLKDRLRQLLGEQFEHEQAIKEYEVKRLAQQIQELKAEIARRGEDRKKIIAERLERAIRGGRPQPTTTRSVRRPGFRPGRGAGAGKPLSPKEAGEVLGFARRHVPELHPRLLALRKEDPRQAESLMRRLGGVMRWVQRLPPEVRQAAIASHALNVEIFSTADRLRRRGDGEERKQLKAKLAGLVDRQFGQDQVVREHQIDRLAGHLAELEQRIRQRRDERDRILAERLEGLLNAPRHGWRPRKRPGAED